MHSAKVSAKHLQQAPLPRQRLRPWAVSADAMWWEPHGYCGAANGSFEPILTNAARRFNVCFANAFDAQSG
jgi:hypothetical protein